MGSRTHEHYMSRALELARRAHFTSPNPKVGCLLVRHDEVVGQGWHHSAGGPHAEINALSEATDAAGASAYVTLEPCTHHGRTAPCAPALVEAGIERVIVAMKDPDERVAGRGLRMLADAGIEVLTGVCEVEARALNATYVHQRLTGRPFLSLKLALSLDGRLAAPDRSARWITGGGARAKAHRRRMEADGVLVGSGTAVADDPSLTVRDVEALRQPARVLLDSSGRTRASAALFGDGEVIVATTARASHELQTGWKDAGAEVVELPSTPDGADLVALLTELGRRGWLELYCEGGARLATSLLKGHLVDRLELHHGAVLLGRGGPEVGDLGVTTMEDSTRWRLVGLEGAGDDVLTTYERKR